MTMRIYRINAETGEELETTETRTLVGTPTVPLGNRQWAPCECPQHR